MIFASKLDITSNFENQVHLIWMGLPATKLPAIVRKNGGYRKPMFVIKRQHFVHHQNWEGLLTWRVSLKYILLKLYEFGREEYYPMALKRRRFFEVLFIMALMLLSVFCFPALRQ